MVVKTRAGLTAKTAKRRNLPFVAPAVESLNLRLGSLVSAGIANLIGLPLSLNLSGSSMSLESTQFKYSSMNLCLLMYVAKVMMPHLPGHEAKLGC